MTIGEKIKNAREDMDLLQIDMARLIPMNQSNYSKIERGIQEPSMEQLRRICQILKLDPRYLLDISGSDIIAPSDVKLLSDIKEFISKHKTEE
ncbi:MAG: helix-turn-helix transcriptional regulator [Ruminococcaceae bacterium]|nr:helix-turn-helix transcriptional regulator [Oscillospiraceae bacterium]